MKHLNLFSLVLVLAVALLTSGCQNNVGTQKVKIDDNSSGTQNVTVIKSTSSNLTSSIAKTSSTKPTTKTTTTIPTTTKEVEIPKQLILPVLFAQQAPFGNWDALHEEACEEASIIMAYKYFIHESLNETIMETEIQKLVSWEESKGYSVDLTAQEIADVLTNHFGLKSRLSFEITADRIKYELSQGNLVIVPVAGREVGNPNFKQPGPIYHVLVIKGYNSTDFITNDPGTRKGNSFTYKYSQLINAVHDWNPQLAEGGMTDAEMNLGRKVMIVVEK